MPVILRTKEEIDCWLTAPTLEALKLERPLPDKSLIVIACGQKMDGENLSQMDLAKDKTQRVPKMATGFCCKR